MTTAPEIRRDQSKAQRKRTLERVHHATWRPKAKIRTVALTFALATLLQAQISAASSLPSTAIPGFDVVSVRPAADQNVNRDYRFTADGFFARNCRIRDLIRFAFILKDDRLVVNLPDDKEASFDILAKVSADDLERFKHLSDLEKRAMLKVLLADRFHLEFHTTQKELPVYALVIDKNGPKLTAAKPDADGKIRAGIRVSGRYTAVATGWTGADFFGLLTQMSGRYIVDRTGLTGSYDFTLRFSPYDPAVDGRGDDIPFDGPVIFTALREQLGLALEPSTAMLDAIVIDHVAAPTPN